VKEHASSSAQNEEYRVWQSEMTVLIY